MWQYISWCYCHINACYYWEVVCSDQLLLWLCITVYQQAEQRIGNENVICAGEISQVEHMKGGYIFWESHFHVVGHCHVQDFLCTFKVSRGEEMCVSVFFPKGVVPVEVTQPDCMIGAPIFLVFMHCTCKGVEGLIVVDVIVYVIYVDHACLCLDPDTSGKCYLDLPVLSYVNK